MADVFQELAKLSPSTIGMIAAFSGAVSAIVAAVVGKLFVAPFLGARDRLDREVEWRKHATS